MSRKSINILEGEESQDVSPRHIGDVDGLALIVDSSRHNTVMLLYDPKYYASRIKSGVVEAYQEYQQIKFKDKMDTFKKYYSFTNISDVFLDVEGIYGYIEINNGRMVGLYRSCNDANEVLAIASRKGYGTLMYVLAMLIKPPIMSNRDYVSDKAMKFWNYFYNNREFFKTEPFKDEKKLHKKDTKDCKVFHISSLDRSYMSKTKFDYQVLKQQHYVFMGQMKSFLKKHDVDFVKSRAKEYLFDAGWLFYRMSND